jgi:hypothetical protein
MLPINLFSIQNQAISSMSAYSVYRCVAGVEKIGQAAFWVFSKIREFFFSGKKREAARLQNRIFFLGHAYPRKSLLFEMVQEAETLYSKDMNRFYRILGRKLFRKSNIFWRYWGNSFWLSPANSYSFIGRISLVKQESDDAFSALKEFYQNRLDLLQKKQRPPWLFGWPEVECASVQLIHAAVAAYIGYQIFLNYGGKIQCTWKN